jgi:hypothetical protein
MGYKSLDQFIKVKSEEMNTNAIPFHNVDHDEFPFAHYIVDKTGRWINKHEYLSGYSFNIKEMNEWLKTWNFFEIHSVDYTSFKKQSSTKIFSKLINGGRDIILMKLTPYNEVNY